MELIETGTGNPMVVRLTPIRESLLIRSKESGSRLEKLWSHMVFVALDSFAFGGSFLAVVVFQRFGSKHSPFG